MSTEVLVVFPGAAHFIEQDIRILETRFSVSAFDYRRRRDRFRLLAELRRSRVAIAWFVLGYAYLMVRYRALHGAKSLLIPGGWDVEALPEFGYGEMLSPSRARRTSFALSRADRVLAVSAHTLSNVRRWAPESRASVLHHGFDSDAFTPDSGPRRGVSTVAKVSRESWKLKGLSTFVEAAKLLPDVPFTIIGKVYDLPVARENIPPNVNLTGFLPRPQLIEMYRRTHVYAQLSAVESFGCSLAEAMLCGCIPVTTDRGALPEVVGPGAEHVPYGDVDATAEAIRRGLESNDRVRPRNRIWERFPLSARAEQLEAEVRILLREKQKAPRSKAASRT